MTTDKELNLLPCPFCGGRPTMDVVHGFVCCVSEDCFGPQTSAVGDDAVEQWNRRTAAEQVRANEGGGTDKIDEIAEEAAGRITTGDGDFNSVKAEVAGAILKAQSAAEQVRAGQGTHITWNEKGERVVTYLND